MQVNVVLYSGRDGVAWGIATMLLFVALLYALAVLNGEKSARGTYLPTYLPAYLPTYLPTFLPTFLPTYLPTHLASFLPTYLPTHLAT